MDACFRCRAGISPIHSNLPRDDVALEVSPGALGESNLLYSMLGPGIQVCHVDIEPSPATILWSSTQRASFRQMARRHDSYARPGVAFTN
jgi:hypothetical protein